MKNNLFSIVCVFLFSISSAYTGNLKGKIKMYDETLSNVIVSLEPVAKTDFPLSSKTVIMDQINMSFVPHVLPVMVGTKVVFPNSDKIRHSVFSNSKTKKFDFGTYPPGTDKFIICESPGVIPVLCYIHHDMSAYIVILSTPYYGLSDDSGEFQIEDIPAGKYKINYWHEESKFRTEEITIPAKGTIIKNITK